MGWGFPERSITSEIKNLGGFANFCGGTGAASCTWMVFSGVGLGSSARTLKVVSAHASRIPACTSTTRWKPTFASVTPHCAISHSQFPCRSILQPGFPSAAKLPAIATVDKRHGTTLAPHSGVSSFVTHGSRQRNYVLRLENAWPARLSAPQAEREASQWTKPRLACDQTYARMSPHP